MPQLSQKQIDLFKLLDRSPKDDCGYAKCSKTIWENIVLRYGTVPVFELHPKEMKLRYSPEGYVLRKYIDNLKA